MRIAFTLLAALNDLYVLAADVMENAHLHALAEERVCSVAGPEFGSANSDVPVLIVRAPHGLKSSGARWRDHMARTFHSEGFHSCLAEPDVWMKMSMTCWLWLATP